MRDSTFTLQALHYLNLDWEADEFMQFVADVEPTEDAGVRSPSSVRSDPTTDRVLILGGG